MDADGSQSKVVNFSMPMTSPSWSNRIRLDLYGRQVRSEPVFDQDVADHGQLPRQDRVEGPRRTEEPRQKSKMQARSTGEHPVNNHIFYLLLSFLLLAPSLAFLRRFRPGRVFARHPRQKVKKFIGSAEGVAEDPGTASRSGSRTPTEPTAFLREMRPAPG